MNPFKAFSPEELEYRRGHIGGSEIAALVGEDRFAGPFDVYCSKVEGWTKPTNPDMQRGHFLEEGIAQWYAAMHECEVFEPKKDPGFSRFSPVSGIYRHAQHPTAGCTPDRLAIIEHHTEKSATKAYRLVSIKAPRRGGDLWGPDGSQQVHTGYVLQLQWEHAILSSFGLALDEEMHLVALVDGELRTYPIRADAELQGQLLGFAEGWWLHHVLTKTPPSLDGSNAASTWLRKRYPTDSNPMRPATAQEEVDALDLFSAESDIETANEAYDLARQKLEASIASAAGIFGVFGAIRWKADKNGKRSFKPQWKSTNAAQQEQQP